jgi:TATA-binding protein-associated factor Taf7
MIEIINIDEYSRWQKMLFEFQDLEAIIVYNKEILEKMTNPSMIERMKVQIEKLENRLERVSCEMSRVNYYV